MSVFRPEQDHDDEGAPPIRRSPCSSPGTGGGRPGGAQAEPARLAVTATSDHCADGLPVVDYTVTNLWSGEASVEIWWLADASVWDTAATYSLGAAPDRVAEVVPPALQLLRNRDRVRRYLLAGRPGNDQRLVGDPGGRLRRASSPTTTPAEPTTTTTPAEPTTTDDGKDKDKGNGHATTTVEAMAIPTGGNWPPRAGGRST